MILPTWLLWYLLAVNVVTWAMFGIDKLMARRHGGRESRPSGRGSYQRVPEAWLLWGSAAGGFVGSWLAIRWFRHKTRKTSFRWKLVFATVAAVAWLSAWVYFALTGSEGS